MNPYEVLGVPRDADPEQIKKAYWEKAKKYHPDRNIGDKTAEEEFKRVQAAYDTLTNPKQPQNGFGFGSFDDIFNQFFHQNRKPSQRGRDIYVECNVTFLEAANGCTKVVNISTGERCAKCNGTGSKDIKTCTVCQGQGMTNYRQGNITFSTTCRHCSGQGTVASGSCPDCEGGIRKDTIPLNVKVPEGIRDGDHLRLAGHGEKLQHPGDAFVIIRVQPHPLFKRHVDDLIFKVPISYGQAVFGDTIEVPTLVGLHPVTVPPEVKAGSELRLVGMGLANPQTGRRGDCVVRLEIDTTLPTSDKAKKYLQKLMATEGVSEIRKVFKEHCDELKQVN